MKRVFAAFIVFFFAYACFAQETAQYNYSFSIRSSRTQDAVSLIKVYLTRYLNLQKTNEESCYIGVVPAFETEREGLKKTLFSAPFTICYKILNGKATFTVTYPYVDKTITICDRSQTTTCEHLAIHELPKDLKRHLDYVGDDIVDHIRDYVNKDEEELPYWFIVPAYHQVSYIIDDDSVTYYAVIASNSGMSQKQLYELAEKFYTYEYRSGKAVIEIRDTEKCIITGKGTYSDVHEEDERLVYSVPHIFSIQCRDGRVRTTITISGIDVYGLFNKSYIGVANNLPFGKEDTKGIKEAIAEAETMIVWQFNSLKKAIDDGLTSLDSMEEW